MIMGQRWCVVGDDAQAAGHAEVNNDRALHHIKEQIFGTPINILYALAFQAFCQIGRNRPTQAAIAHGNPGDGLALAIGCNAATGGFYFWQFLQVSLDTLD